jgi:hypothetical protein
VRSTVGQRHDARPLGLAQSVLGRGPDSLGPAVGPDLTVLAGAPALEGPQVDAGQAAGGGQPRPGGTGHGNLGSQGLAVLPAGHSSSPSRKTAPSFFASTSKAAVSARALGVVPIDVEEEEAALPALSR